MGRSAQGERQLGLVTRRAPSHMPTPRSQLVAAVSEAGGLGILTGLTAGSPEKLRESIREVRKLTNKPLCVGPPLVLEPSDSRAVPTVPSTSPSCPRSLLRPTPSTPRSSSTRESRSQRRQEARPLGRLSRFAAGTKFRNGGMKLTGFWYCRCTRRPASSSFTSAPASGTRSRPASLVWTCWWVSLVTLDGEVHRFEFV